MIRKNIKYLLLLIPLAFTIGFSSWIIMYSFEFGPVYKKNYVSELFLLDYDHVYDNQYYLPQPITPIDQSCLSYKYKIKNSSSDFINVDIENNIGPKDAGSYEVIITVSGYDHDTDPDTPEINGDCKVRLEITPKQIKILNKEFSIKHNIADETNVKCDPWWQSVQSYIKSKIKIVDKNNVEIPNTEIASADIKFTGMHNGVFYYGDVGQIGNSLINKTSNDMIGSTYISNISLIDDIANNYEFIDGNVITIKYKTVSLGGDLYTIEDAIAQGSGNMTLLGGKLDGMVNSYVKTCFSLVLDTKEYTISSNRNLLIPYNSSGTELTRNRKDSTNVVYSVLYIPKNIVLNISSAKVTVASYITQGGLVRDRGVIFNKGDINLINSTFNSYGFTKGDGMLNVDKDSTVVDVFRLYDWPGADEALTLKDSNAFPVNQWSVHNVSCSITFHKDSVFKAISFLVVLSIVGLDIDDVFIIGKSNTEQCLFRPSSLSTQDDYIVKQTTINNDSISTHNQVYGQKDSIYINGFYEDKSVKVSATGYSFVTSTSIAIPLSYFDIYVSSGQLDLSNSSYIAQNETANITVSPNAILNITGDAYVALLGTSKLTLKGVLKGNGYFGGLIQTDVENASIEVSHLNVDSIIVKTGTTTVATKTQVSKALVIENDIPSDTEKELTSGTVYISTVSNNKGYFEGYPSNLVTTYSITYILNGDFNNGLSETETVTTTQSFISINESYIINLDSLSNSFSSSFFNEKHLFYEINNWYLDSSFKDESLFSEVTLTKANSTLTLYAKWVEKPITFFYIVEYMNSTTKEKQNINALVNIDNPMSSIYISTFNSVNSIKITSTVNYDNKHFDGWYIGNAVNETYKIGNTLTKEQFLYYIENSGYDVIYLYCLFTDYKKYNIVFQNVETGVTLPNYTTLYGNENLSLPIVTSYNDNPSIMNYYAYWSFVSFIDPLDNPIDDETYIINNIRVDTLISNIELFNAKQTDDNKKVNISDTIYVYGKLKKKEYTVNYYKLDTAASGIYNTYYYAKNSNCYAISRDNNFYIANNNDDTRTYYIFNNWIINVDGQNKNINPGDKIELSDSYTISVYSNCSIEYIQYKITIGTLSNSTLTLDDKSVKKDEFFWVKSGDSIKLTVTANSNYKSPKIVIGNNEYDNTVTITVESPFTIETNATYNGCIAIGTLITLANGTQKKVEDLSYNDNLLVFNHYTGDLESVPISLMLTDVTELTLYNVVYLYFSNGEVLKIIGDHSFFSVTYNKYININEFVASDYIHTNFLSLDDNKLEVVELVDVQIIYEYTIPYSIVTYKHLTCFTNSILTGYPYSDYLLNVFNFNQINFQYDLEKIDQDIEKYGIISYDEFNSILSSYGLSDIISYYEFDLFNLQYINITIGKGLITWDDAFIIFEVFKDAILIT